MSDCDNFSTDWNLRDNRSFKMIWSRHKLTLLSYFGIMYPDWFVKVLWYICPLGVVIFFARLWVRVWFHKSWKLLPSKVTGFWLQATSRVPLGRRNATSFIKHMSWEGEGDMFVVSRNVAQQLLLSFRWTRSYFIEAPSPIVSRRPVEKKKSAGTLAKLHWHADWEDPLAGYCSLLRWYIILILIEGHSEFFFFSKAKKVALIYCFVSLLSNKKNLLKNLTANI